MTGGHWTEQDFINHVYGIGPADSHLDVCDVCRARWDAIRVQREAILQEPDVPAELLAAQRRAVHRRLTAAPRRWFRSLPAFAAALVLLLGIILSQPSVQPPPPVAVSASDSQLFADIYALEQNSEPQASTTVHALFEEN